MQGCLLAPTLSSLMFSAMLTDAYKDCVASISIRHRSDHAADRLSWRNLIHSGAHVAEDNRTDVAAKKHERCKARAARNQQTTPIHMCPTCGRGFHSRIGHISHLRTPPNQLQEQLRMFWSSSTPKDEQTTIFI